MAERMPSYVRYANMLVLVGFGWLALLLQMTPLDVRASALPPPDLLFCVAAFLVIRRPSSTPVFLVVCLGLARDLIGGGPVGLGALVLIAAVEALRFQRDTLIRSWPREIAAVAVTVVAMNLAQVAAMTVVFAPSPPLDILAQGAALTVAAYIVVALIFRHLFRIRGEAVENHRLIGRPAPERSR